MVVVMAPEATEGDIEEIVELVSTAGGEAFVSRGVSRTIIGLVGDVEQFGALNLRSYPGVTDVVRISVPYKLVSRENPPNRSVITVGGVPIGPGHLTVIAGPCTVETAEQTLTAARMAPAAGASLLRGGAYKPRTSPYAFQGLGEAGLRILADVKPRPDCPSSPRSSTRPPLSWSAPTLTCSRLAPAACRTSPCCRQSAPPASRCC